MKTERFLSREERMQKFPLPEEILLPEKKLRVIKGYRLELNTDVRYETYAVFEQGSLTKFYECEQVYFAPYLVDVAEFVSSSLEQAMFPSIYRGWSAKDKINYWVSELYRLRRQTGEIGADEDDVIGTDLIDKMKEVDVDILKILPQIIKGLAAMENISQEK